VNEEEMEEMDQEEFNNRIRLALSNHTLELDGITNTLIEAAREQLAVPNSDYIFKEISDAVGECRSSVEHYEGEVIPKDVSQDMSATLQAVSSCIDAVVLYGNLLQQRNS
jgi:hypothetical protein